MSAVIAVTIAGSDSGGGAGIQADLKTFSALGVYGASVITALTAQNTKGVTAVHQVPADFIAAQMDAVFSDLHAGAVKIGMLGNAEAIDAVAKGLERHRQHNVVLDPVMIATSGEKLLRDDAVDALRKLIARARVLTPNLPEAAALLDAPVARDEDEMRAQAQKLLGARRRRGADQRRPRRRTGKRRPLGRRRCLHALCRAADRDTQHPRYRLYAVRGHRRGPCQKAVVGRCRDRRQGLRQRSHCRRRPARRRIGQRPGAPFPQMVVRREEFTPPPARRAASADAHAQRRRSATAHS